MCVVADYAAIYSQIVQAVQRLHLKAVAPCVHIPLLRLPVAKTVAAQTPRKSNKMPIFILTRFQFKTAQALKTQGEDNK